ncbi:Superoxide dismutase [Cu-Zn] precursor [Pigmentiphaga humi]|uniref:Superoxide dismutase [Cu-Zn] n=1 Tax=Pigmentiphaga humi TaxID=2478468 RepID=A0A3P4B500_9BURK|nr:superoxide dismutase family protein [Pigmentiphaga humi]VCU70596.1 Superoxide dismutase [Cu-Zn] precursor [Pigmentiphaga humi]
MKLHLGFALALSLAGAPAWADLSIPVSAVDAQGKGRDLGTVKVAETAYGLVFRPELKGLAPGMHGFHVHANPSCEPGRQDGKPVAALAAGGHLDPKKTGKHGEPWDDGAHLGDLPALVVDTEGKASYPVLAPRLKSLADIKGRSLMVHMGGDNHSDHPLPLGGGGARMACGVIPG